MRRARKDSPSPTDPPANEIYYVPARPPAPPRIDEALWLDSAEQQALKDAASGELDVYAAIAIDGRLPYEDVIDSRTRAVQHGAEQSRFDNPVLAKQFENTAAHVPDRTRAWDTASLEPLPAAEERVDQLAEQLSLTEQHREAAGAILDGRSTAKDGTKWTGVQPPVPTSERRIANALRPARTKAWASDIGLPAGLLLLELWIVRGTLQRDLRTDSIIEGLVYAVPAVLLATVIPYVLGAQLAGLARRDNLNRTDRFVLAMAPVWVAAAVFLARLRTQTAEQAAVARAARDRGISVSDVDPAQVYDFGWAWAMWMTILLGIGIALMAVKIAFYNPALTAALKADSQLAVLRPRYRNAIAHRDRLTADVEMQRLAAQTNEQAWRWHIDHTLPAIAENVKAHYRKTLITAVADPSFTTGIATSPLRLEEPGGGPPAATDHKTRHSSIGHGVSATAGTNSNGHLPDYPRS